MLAYVAIVYTKSKRFGDLSHPPNINLGKTDK